MKARETGEREDVRAGATLAVLLGLLWGWWALAQGAYLPVDFYPGAAGLLALLALLIALAPWRGNLRGAPLIALATLVLLAAWTALSVLWTPSPDSALEDAHHVAAYAASFAVGMWICLLLGRRMALALLPLAIGGAIAGVGTVAAILLGSDAARFLDEELTLELPLGYRNGTAAFFLIAFWAALAAAAGRELDWRARGLLTGAGTLALEMAVLAQSRGSLAAFAAAAVVYFAIAPARGRSLARLVLCVAPVALALPWLLEVFAGAETRAGAAPLLEDAAVAVAATTALSVALGVAAGRLEPGAAAALRGGRARVLAVASAVVIVAAGAAIAVAVERVGDAGTATRFGIVSDPDRVDFWRVSLIEARDAPLTGTGAGGFRLAYLKHRDSDKTPTDPHAVEMLMLSELGAPGLLLLLAFLAASVAGALRARRLGPAGATLAAGALAVAAYWLVHSSVDWFWSFPGITAPVAALLGAACAPAIRQPQAGPPGPRRLVLAAPVALLALSCLPPYMSALWLDRAYRGWASDPATAFADLDRARAANPLSEEPLLAEGAIAARTGDPPRALDAFRRAREKEPENWAPHYFIGRALLRADPAAALASLQEAARLNPLSEEVARAEARARARLAPGE